MNGTRRLSLVLSAVCGIAAPGLAQEFVEPDRPAGPDANVFFIDDSNFDQWVFGGQQNAQAARTRFDSLLKVQIEEIDRTCGLTDAQKKKLMLAGRGDVKRFLDQVEEKRKEFQQVKADQTRFGQFYQTLRPLQQTYAAGLFGEGSFYDKATRTILDSEQVARIEDQRRAKLEARYKARVELVAASLGNTAGLSADQRRRLVAVLLDETKAPRSFGQNDYQVVLLQASKVPEEKLKPIVDDRQWQVLSQQFRQMQRMEPSLRAGGYVPADEAAPPAADPPAAGANAIRAMPLIRLQAAPAAVRVEGRVIVAPVAEPAPEPRPAPPPPGADQR